MILYPPQKFDWNEWCVTISLILHLIVFFLLPRKFPLSITTLLLLFGISQAKTSDFILDKLFELYYANDSMKYEWFDILLIGVYAPFGYYFIYIYETWKLKGLPLFIYICLSGLFSIGIEYLANLVNVFHYTGWKLLYSFPVYLISLSCTLFAYRLITAIMERNHAKKMRSA